MSELKAIESATAVIENVHFVYIKSEADKVIAHQKYKRCLAMAKWCACERDIYNLTPKVAREEHYCKWHKRWLAIAEKFKEAK